MIRSLACACWCVLFLATGAHAQSWSFTRIADTNTIVPGSSSTFTLFNAPSIRDGTLGLAGFAGTTTGPAGVFIGSGGPLTTIADRATPIPNGTGNFIGFAQGEGFAPSLHGGATAFVGDGAGAGMGLQRGIYLRDGSSLTRVVDRNTQIPNAPGANFSNIREPSLESGRVAFVGELSPSGGPGGVYSWQSGSLSVVADHTTFIPNGPGTFDRIFDCDLDQGSIIFTGRNASGHHGLYRSDAGGLTRLYDSTMVVPGGNGGNFTFLGQGVQSDGHVAFYGQGGGQEGIYSDVSGTLQVIANRSTPIPGFPGLVFAGFSDAVIDGGIVGFDAIGPGGLSGVFSTHTGTLAKVLATGDLLDGRIVDGVGIEAQALEGQSMALWVSFTNSDYGVYMATIPAPGTMIVGGVLLLGARRRRSC